MYPSTSMITGSETGVATLEDNLILAIKSELHKVFDPTITQLKICLAGIKEHTGYSL
jgi:hypothetical protein